MQFPVHPEVLRGTVGQFPPKVELEAGLPLPGEWVSIPSPQGHCLLLPPCPSLIGGLQS